MSRKTKKESVKDLAQELDVFDVMLSSLVELLEEKGVLIQEEWEKRIAEKLSQKKKSYRDVQF